MSVWILLSFVFQSLERGLEVCGKAIVTLLLAAVALPDSSSLALFSLVLFVSHGTEINALFAGRKIR